MEEDHVSSDEEFNGGSDCLLSRHAEIGLESMTATGHVADGPELNDLLGLRSGAAVDDIIRVRAAEPG